MGCCLQEETKDGEKLENGETTAEDSCECWRSLCIGRVDGRFVYRRYQGRRNGDGSNSCVRARIGQKLGSRMILVNGGARVEAGCFECLQGTYLLLRAGCNGGKFLWKTQACSNACDVGALI